MELDPRLRSSDFDVLQVDFEWVARTNHLKTLKQAYDAIRRERAYPGLETALRDKIKSIEEGMLGKASPLPHTAKSSSELTKPEDSWDSGVRGPEDAASETNEMQGALRSEGMLEFKDKDPLKLQETGQSTEGYGTAYRDNPSLDPQHHPKLKEIGFQHKTEFDEPELSNIASIIGTDEAAQDLVDVAAELKNIGNDLYQRADFQSAIAKYTEAMEQLVNIDLEQPLPYIDQLKASVLNNIALCYVQMSQPDKVIQLTTSSLYYSNSSKPTQIKAYLLRGLAYEQTEKHLCAKVDMLACKRLDSENIQATQCLHRLSTVLKPDAELNAEEAQRRLEKMIEDLDRLRSQGNTLFLKGEMDLAIIEYTAAIDQIKTFPTVEIAQHPQLRAFIVMLANNRAAANLSLGCNMFAINDSRLALKFDESSAKAHYRLAKALANCNEHTEAIKHYTRVIELMPEDQAVKNELAELQAKLRRTSQPSPQELESKRKKSVSFLDTTTLRQDPEFFREDSPKSKAKQLTEVDRDIVEKAKQMALGQGTKLEKAKNASTFESEARRMKSNLALFYEYLQLHEVDYLCRLFASVQLSSETYNQIIRSVFAASTIDVAWTTTLLQSLPTLSGYSLLVKFLSKAEKSSVRDLVGKLGLSDDAFANLLGSLRV